MRFFIVLIFVLLSCHFLQAQDLRTHKSIIACTVSGYVEKVDVINEYGDPRLFVELSVYPLNWLSAGVYFSPDYGSSYLLKKRHKSYGGDIALHSYPIFRLLEWNYFKDHIDISVGGFYQQNIKKEYWYGIEDNKTHEIIPTDNPTLFNAKSNSWGKTLGVTYFIIHNVGISAEVGKIGNARYTHSQYKFGLIFRL